MLKWSWLPYKFLIQRAARAYNVIDPVSLLARLRQFAQPSEVQEPFELLRAGILFHARGLVNTRAIQYNLDWNWPYWVVKQFDPKDPSFIPRGFSFSHVNLTHRNWTALGLPSLSMYPIVDPRGLTTPLLDGWSIDFWLISKTGESLFPSHLPRAHQCLEMASGLGIKSTFRKDDFQLQTLISVRHDGPLPELICNARGFMPEPGWIVVALRPFNPEGIQFIDRITWDPDHLSLRINDLTDIIVNELPAKVLFSDYEAGDVANRYSEPPGRPAVECPIGMATAAAFFSLSSGTQKDIQVRVPLKEDPLIKPATQKKAACSWEHMLARTARLNIPDEKMRFLYNSAVRTLILLSADEVFPGPYTYRRFWFRDAAFMIQALLALGLENRARRLLTDFPRRQKLSGYFQSQDGEWDSNGQVLWIVERFQQATGQRFDAAFNQSLMKGADWIQKKRTSKKEAVRHRGLLPAGFSAEHLGPNDFYFWDDFWGVAGLQAAARMAQRLGYLKKRFEFERNALDLEKCIFESIAKIPEYKRRGGIPASPYRRMDAGAVGSMAADYPLQITGPGEPLIQRTVDFLIRHCFQRGAFFQDMIHSGLNAYLTLAIAQTLLRQGDPRYGEMIETVAGLASPTGQWPEAIHPVTGGGCMGDGQHGWAAAEWIMMIRNLFVREEGQKIVIGSGIFPRWLKEGNQISFGPTPTPAGRISVFIDRQDADVRIELDTDARDASISLEIDVPGYPKRLVPNASRQYLINAA